MAGNINKQETRGFKEGRTFTLMDKHRLVEKVVFVTSLEDFVQQGRELLGYGSEEEVWVVLEEDGTEVDENEYLELLPERTPLMLLARDQLWSPTLTMQGSCFFDGGSTVSAGQLANALLNHLKRSSVIDSHHCNVVALDEDDFPIHFKNDDE